MLDTGTHKRTQDPRSCLRRSVLLERQRVSDRGNTDRVKLCAGCYILQPRWRRNAWRGPTRLCRRLKSRCASMIVIVCGIGSHHEDSSRRHG